MSYDPVQGIYESGMDAEQGVQEVNAQIAAMTQKIADLDAMLPTLNASTAFIVAVYLMALIGQQQNLVQVAKPAQELDVQNSLLNGVTLQQSLYNQLCIGADGYNNSVQYGVSTTGTTQIPATNTGPTYTDSNGHTVKTGDYVDSNGNYVSSPSQAAQITVPCDTAEQQQAYQQTMQQFDECTAMLQTVVGASLNPDSQYYNWLDPNTANSLYANEQAISQILDPNAANDPTALADQCASFSYQYMTYTANPSQPTDPQGYPVNSDPNNGPVVNADPYPVASNVQILTQAFNTNISMVNSVTQTTTGQIKAGTAEVQQYYGSVEDMGQDQVQGRQTNVNNQRAN